MDFASILTQIDDVLYTWLLIYLLAGSGIYFTVRTRFVQIRRFRDALACMMEKKEGDKGVSSFQALMIATASRVGTGNMAGVATAIILGGPGAAFWMWLMAVLGSASAFVESTLAQIYKKKEGDSFKGGPAYYIERALHARWLGIVFAISLIATFAFGFNGLQAYNIVSAFDVYTADMETDLDEIAEGKADEVETLTAFWKKFSPLLDEAYEKMEKIQPEKVGEKCPECGGDLVYRNGRFGKFISCSNFPKCRYTRQLDGKEKEKPEPTGKICPECGGELLKRKSRFGTYFLGCSNFPKCRYMENLDGERILSKKERYAKKQEEKAEAAPAEKKTARKTATKKTAAKKTTTKKTAAAKKSPAKKTTTKKTAARKKTAAKTESAE